MNAPYSTLPHPRLNGYRKPLQRVQAFLQRGYALGVDAMQRDWQSILNLQTLPVRLLNASRTVMTRLLRITLMLLICIGAATVWDAKIGDGPLPTFNTLTSDVAEHRLLARMAQRNSTADWHPLLAHTAPHSADYWAALYPSRRLLNTLSPTITKWLDTLHREEHITLSEPEDIHATYQVSADTELLAAYRYSENTLYLGQGFWRLRDGEKAAILTHEYRHSRQNVGKRLSHQLAQLIGLGNLQQDSPMEAEALAYEQAAKMAMGLI